MAGIWEFCTEELTGSEYQMLTTLYSHGSISEKFEDSTLPNVDLKPVPCRPTWIPWYLMLYDFAEVALDVVVEVDLDDVEVADGADLLEEDAM